MPIKAKKKGDLSHDFELLPAYAQFILDHHLEDFVTEQLRLSREIKIPILKYLDNISDADLFKHSLQSTSELLTYFTTNDISEQISTSIEKWKGGQLPLIAKDALVADDIAMISYVRKQAFLHFLPQYTKDVSAILNIVQEIDRYILRLSTSSFKVYIDILLERIEEKGYFIEKINNTSPGIIYAFDLLENKEVYSNHRGNDFLGYTSDELKALGSNYLNNLQHPDDVELVKEHFSSFKNAVEGEVISFEHRIRGKDGKYHWMRNYESIFKRLPTGEPSQIIGISLLIDKEKKMAEKLSKREEQLKEAQEIAGLGSFEWNPATGYQVSPQVYQILKLESGVGMEVFLQKIHPADRDRVKVALQNTLEKNEILDEEYRFLTGTEEKVIWSRATVTGTDENKRIRGTVMDVTLRHHMVQKLQNSEKLYKEAQALSHIGNWTWLLENNMLTWSDEMYRIFETNPHNEAINIETLLTFFLPSVRDEKHQKLLQFAEERKGGDYTVEILTWDNKRKILQVKSEVRINENGEPYKIVGTCQDITEKQLLIDKLEKSDKLYKQAQALSHIGNWSYNLADNTLVWSDELFRIYEMEPKEILKYDELHQYNVPEEKEKIEELISTQLRTYEPHQFYYQVQLPSGVRKVILSKGEVLLDDEGKPYQMIGTAQDVTEQKRIEKELLDNQVFLKKIADAAPSIIASYNIKTGIYSFISEGLKKLLGYEPAEVLEKGVQFFVNLIHPDDLQELMEKNEQAMKYANSNGSENDDEVIIEFQYRMRNSSGQYKWFTTYGTVFDRNSEGLVENVLNITIDITEQREAEAKLQEQENFTRHIAEASPTILYLYDLKEQRFIYVNKEVTQVLGFLPEDILKLGNKVTPMFLHPEDEITKNKNHIKYPLAGGSTMMHQIEGRVKDIHGNWKWLLTREMVIKRDEKGQALQVVGSALDITDRKQMEQTLIQKTIQLQQSNTSLEEFAHIASHDLQEPLRKIATFGDRLLTKHAGTLSEDGKLYLDKMIHSSHRMQQLINDILSISLISGDKTFKLTSLQDILDEVLQVLDVKIEKTNATIHSDQLPEVNVIPSQFRQLFQNLLSNSLKFIPKDVPPVIRISYSFLSPTKAAKYQLKESPKYLELKFSDNGIGFDEIYAEKIFAIFQRLHGRSEFEGTGIGLSICRRIIEHHQGVIFGSSSNKGGATFTIIIPA